MKRVVLLWHGSEPIGICIFSCPVGAVALRSRFFALSRPGSATHLAALNERLWVLSRVVLHPTYRGAGIAAGFVRRACQTSPIPWIETLSAMARVNPFFERAGFKRIGIVQSTAATRKHRTANPFSAPAYFLFDNRRDEEPRA